MRVFRSNGNVKKDHQPLEIESQMDPLTASIIDTASALKSQQLAGEMNVRLLDKALDAQAQQALSLLSTLPAGDAPSGGGVGQLLDIVA